MEIENATTISSEASMDNGLIFCFPELIEESPTGFILCIIYIVIFGILCAFGYYIRTRLNMRVNLQRNGNKNNKSTIDKQSSEFQEILGMLPGGSIP
jgi:hypothetical protein